MVKTLTIREDVYKKLLAIKGPDESFSELFERLADSQGSLALLRSLRGDLNFNSDEERKSFLRDIYSRRGGRRT
jgi:predicted CopG family antitoxin